MILILTGALSVLTKVLLCMKKQFCFSVYYETKTICGTVMNTVLCFSCVKCSVVCTGLSSYCASVFWHANVPAVACFVTITYNTWRLSGVYSLHSCAYGILTESSYNLQSTEKPD